MHSFNVNEGPYQVPVYGTRHVTLLQSFPEPVKQFIRDAAREDPDFLGEYLVPILERPNALEEICEDISDEVARLQCEQEGLGDLGYLGKSFLKKVTHAVRRVHQAIEKKVVPKAIRNIEQKVAKVEQKVVKSVKKETKKIWVKYGPIILMVLGAVLTVVGAGPILIAAAAVLQAANTAYAMKRKADAAKQANRREADQLQAQAAAADAQTQQQVDQFFQQNQSWFAQYGVTPDKWAQLNTQQKVDLINALANGKLPPGSVAVPDPATGVTEPIPPSMPVAPPVAPPSGPSPSAGQAPFDYSQLQTAIPAGGGPSMPAGSGYVPPGYPSGGGGDASSVWGGSGIGPSGATSSYQPSGTPQQPTQAQSGMFGGGGGMMIPAAIIAAAVIFSSGRKAARRNPGRRRGRR